MKFTPTHSQIYEWSYNLLSFLGFNEKSTHILNTTLLFVLVLLILYVVDFLFRKVLLIFIIRAIRKTETRFDDYLLRNKVVKYFIHIITVIIAQVLLPLLFVGFPKWIDAMMLFSDTMLIISIGLFVNGLVKSVRDWLKSQKDFQDKPIDSYAQVVSMLIFFVCGILIISDLSGKSPYTFLLSLGAASAVLLLVFKDTILGFVASIQVSVNDMVRVGDWVEMSKYGADGNVLSINLNTVKIQNFDKTITTVPTYAFITDSFKNWRGMTTSGGRRIKRSINFKMSSFGFCDTAMLERFKNYRLISEYISQKEAEIAEHNAKLINHNHISVNIRRQTNIGIFRIYAENYLKQNPNINQKMPVMVRQLQPTSQGLPLEVYCFTKEVRWEFHERAMADIFDHLLTVASEFNLEIFEEPTGADFSRVIHSKANSEHHS